MTYTRRSRVKITTPSDEVWDRVFSPGGVPMYYNRAGQPCTMREWTEAFEDHRLRFVARDYVLGAWVATIYDGLDPDMLEGGPPTMFETTVFRKGRSGHRSGHRLPEHLDGWQERYTSEREALEGHWRIRSMVRTVSQDLNGPPPLAVTVKRGRRR